MIPFEIRLAFKNVALFISIPLSLDTNSLYYTISIAFVSTINVQSKRLGHKQPNLSQIMLYDGSLSHVDLRPELSSPI